jgi:hypothetical protein
MHDTYFMKEKVNASISHRERERERERGTLHSNSTDILEKF